MTETSFQYTLIQPLPVASPPTYLLIIDSSVSNYQDIINAKQPGVYHIIFDAPTRPTHSKKLIKDIEDKIAELGVAAFTGVGFVQHNDEKPFYEMLGQTSDVVKPRIRYVETVDPNIHSWNSITSFITILRQNYGIEYFDMMACALYSNPDWKYIIDRLGALTGVAVRASTDDTGAAVLGGDWFLESHTGVNLKSVYFTESIENYNGLLYTAPAPTSTTPPTKKLILIDNRIKEIDVIINSINSDTYCLVFNYFYDTPATILSKLRFLNSDNRYILDSFYYETPELPTRMDASGNHCTPCDDFDITDMQLLPETLQNEYLEYTTFSPDASGNGGVWPFYSESTKIAISKPVFFQRAKIGETAEQVVYPSTDVSSVILNYKYRPMVLVSDLDEMYELGQNVGEIVGGATAFECVGIIQHTVDPYIGYKFIGGGDDSVSPAIIQDVVSRDASLSSWAAFTGVIQSLKTVHQTTTLDMLACALYANPDWKYIIDTLAARENIKIRASLDNTGFAAAEDGEANWVLETDDVSLTTVYFTDKIYEWKYVLATYIDTRFNALRWDGPANAHTGMYATRAYDSRLKIAAGTNPFTIETWYYETTTRFNCTIVDMGNYNYTFLIRNQNLTDPKGLSFYSNLLSDWLYAESAVVPIAQWSHLAITRSGSTFTFYVNGIARQTITSSVSFNSNNSTFAIGLQSPDNCACNKMKLDTVLYDIRLWNVARTATQIQMFRNRVVPANSTGLVANYLCTDNGSSLNDRTSNTLHTTIQNYDSTRWSNTTVPIPNIGFLINNSYSLRTSNTGTALNAFTHFNDITYTDFSGVDLSGANFSGGDLTGCNFTNANLTNTDFTNAYLISATTTNATTTGSNIAQALSSYTPNVLILDGNDDAVDLGIPAWTYSTQFRQTMTVECWFRTMDTNNQKGVAWFISRNITAGFTTGSSFSLGMNPAGIIIFWIQGQNNSPTFGSLASIGAYKDARWHHAAVTYQYNTGVINMYVDGVLDATSTAANVGILSYNTTTKLVIGSDHSQFTNGSIDRQFRGSLSDIRVWNVVRSASEIADNYRRRLVGNESGLVGYWKLNQGRGSGWSSYYAVLDSTSNIPYGTLTGQGAGNWTISNINFQPRISAITLGANNGVYNFTDSSFSFIDPSSNSLGSFSYAVSPSSVATIANGAATTKTIYSLSAANLVPTYATFEFPEIASLSSWQIDISFTVTGGTSTWRALIGDMYNQINPRGWGVWVSSSNRIHWSWMSNAAEPTSISVSLNTPYVLTAAQSSGTITLTLRTVSSGATQTGSFGVGANVIGKGPVTIGNWIGWGAEYFPGTISYVNVSVPTNHRVVTFSSVTDGTPATVSAIQDISLDFGSGSRTASLTVNKIAPTIGSLTAPAKNFGAVAFDLTAPTSNSDGAITYTSSVAGVATVTSGGTVSIVGAGSTTITATQAASGNYTGGSVTATLVVSAIAPTIGALSVPAKNFGASAFDITAPSSNSNGDFIYSSSAEGVATVTSGGRVTVVGVGSTTITATQEASADGNYTSGTSVSAPLVVSAIAPTYQAIAQVEKTYSTDISFSMTSVMSGKSDSSGAYTFSSTSDAISIDGGVATILAYTPSAITITATQDASGNYTASTKTFTLLVARKTPSYGAFTVPAATYEGTPFSIAEYAPTTDSSGIPFTYTSSEPSVATINSDGTVMTIVGHGYTTITASQVAGGNYAAGSITTSFLVNRAAPTFLKAFTITDKTFGNTPFSLLPFTEGLDNTDGTYHFTSSNAQLVSISEVDGVTATIHAYTPTPITIYVAIDACGNYAASSTSGTLTVARAAPTIGALSVPAKNFGADAFDITAPSSNSNGNFIYSSSAPAVATVSTTGGVGTVSIVGVGSTTITATQDASGNYTGGSSVTATLVVSAIAPTIGTMSVPAKNIGDASFNITAPSSNSDGAITYTSSSPAVATVSTTGGVGRVTIVGAGSTTITATQDASGNYTGGSVTSTLVVSEPLSNFTVPADKKYGDATFDLTDPISIDDNVSFTFTSSNSAVASIGGGGGRTVTIVNAGSSIITATQAATANRDEANISATLVVARITPVITLAAIPKTYGSASFRLTPTSTNTDDISGTAFSFSSNNTSVASIVDTSFVIIDGVGEATITITQSTTTNFTVGNGSVVITVSKGTPVLSTFSVSANKTFGSAPFSALLTPTSASAGAITYSSSDASVATIDNSGLITLLAQGYVNFTATQAATALYNSATKTSNTMTVHRQAIVLTRASPSSEVVSKTYGDDNFTVSATNISSGAITYESDNPSVASVINASTGVISVGTVGTAIITASRAQTAQYTSDPVSWTVQVARTTTTLTGLANLTRNVTVEPFAVAASSASDGAVSYALQDLSSTVLTIHPTTGVITLKSPGSAVIVASQAQGTLYEAPASITATITVTSVGNTLQGATLTSTANFSNVNLNGGNLNNVNINNSNFTGVDLSGATLTSATITGATFTGASLVRADLTGATLTSTVFTNVDLSGGILVDVDASGASFANATLRNVNLTGANVTNVNFTNTNIKGANITDVSFSPLQKIQLLKNSDNRDINAIAISSVSGSTVLAAISESSPLRSIPNLDLTSVESVAVIIPQTATLSTTPISNVEIDVATYDKFYLPINEGEYFKINDVRYYSSSNVIRNYATNEIVEIITYGGKPIWLFVGSILGLVLQSNTLNTSSFVVPSDKSLSDQTPFMPTTLPTSNSSSPIVYSSSNTNIATINATTGEITITGNTTGIVTFTATQVQNATYEPGTITSNSLVVDQYIHFSLVGLNQSFNLTTLASLDAFNLIADTTDATAVFYVRLSDMTDVFKYQSDSADVNDISATDLKYYVFNRKWPAELKINPSHAMLNKADSAGMLGTAQLFSEDKMLVKHDFVRYLALKLFNTIHGVDLFKNETDLQENATYYGENIRNNINEILSGISTTSGDETMAYDASGNKYLTNSASGNTNICRELMRQIASSVASRFYNNGADDAGMKMVPLHEDDTMTFKVIIQAAATQNILTGVSEIPSRSYTIKLVLKSSVTSVTNANTVISDSEMFPNSYPYSSSVSSIAPDSEAAATVYNIYSPPAPIPFSRFGFNGWYYANSSEWVSANSGVRNHVKWLLSSNSAGSSTVNALQYIRLNLKIHNKTALPYLMVYTQSGSWRKYVVSGGGGSLTNGTKYSFYTNFNSYSREPAMIGYTNVELVNTLGNGGFASNEVITNIALETDSAAAAGTVEFTLASIIVGELASGVPSEKEYGFLAAVPSAAP